MSTSPDLGVGVVDFESLFIVPEWVRAHCIVPDGARKGEPFGPVGWQLWAFLNFYRVRPGARVGQLAPAFHWRRSQIVLPQKGGKAPHTSGHICVEGVGPALFAGWAVGGEVWDCRDHGCGCGWRYEYEPGEAMGRRWPTPLIQITAFSEKQTDNIYSALRPMIDDGPLSPLIPKTGEEFIRLPNGGRIDVVTAEAQSRLGARVTFVPQDETGIWTKSAGMIKVAETQRRGLAGMGGRAEETTNAWDPNEGSVAQRTAESKTGDIFRLHPLAARGLSYTNKADRRKIHRVVYEGCSWIDLDAIEGEAAELIETDPGQAERFFGNRPVAGSGSAFNIDHWDGLVAKPAWSVPAGEMIVIGIDGARHDDALAVVACDVRTGYVWVLDIIERPDDAKDDYQHDKNRVDQVVRDAFDRWVVWRLYADPQHIADLIKDWSNEFGARRVIEWATYRPRPIAWAVRNFETAVARSDVSHDGSEVLGRHIANAKRRELTVKDDKERFMHTLSKDGDKSPRKIDGAMAAVLAWEARSDCIAAGGMSLAADVPEEPVAEPDKWRPGHAPGGLVGAGVEVAGPMGSLS